MRRSTARIRSGRNLQRSRSEQAERSSRKCLFCTAAFKTLKRRCGAKTIIVAALGYFIAPMDAIPDVMPGVGFSDDLGALAVALAAVAMHIKPEHRQQAKEKLTTWFGDDNGATASR